MASAGAATCTIGESEIRSINLDVPLVTQQQLPWDYCGPASVLMWRLYRGGAPLELAQIHNFMGGAGSGTSPGQIRSATAYYAGVNDAYVDYGAQDPDALKREFFARQITSVSAHAPVIVIAESGFHAVVLKGGSWSKDAQGLLNVWDDVYFNDPKWLYERYQSSADWTEYSLGG